MNFTLQSVATLFPTPLLRFAIDDAAALNRDLLAEIAARRGAEPGVTRTNRLGWHSAPDLFERTEPAQARLAQAIKQAAAAATRKLAPDAPLDRLQLVCDGWINVNPAGAYNSPHDHGGAFWSGAYYVAVPEVEDGGDGGAIEFIAPHPQSAADILIKAPITAAQARFRPEAGTLLIFPARLTHWVHPNPGPDNRVTIAFNATLRQIMPDDGQSRS